MHLVNILLKSLKIRCDSQVSEKITCNFHPHDLHKFMIEFINLPKTCLIESQLFLFCDVISSTTNELVCFLLMLIF